MPNQANIEWIFNCYRQEAVIFDTPRTKIWVVSDEDGRRYAAKLTSVNESDGGSFYAELEVFRALTNGQISFGRRSYGQTPLGFPNVYYVGNHKDEYNVIVMDMLSPDLLYLSRNRSLSVITWQGIACQMLDCVEELHRHGFVHRDIKPQNFMMDPWGKVHLIDFGLAKRYRDIRSNAHLPERGERFFSGTPMYGSVNAQRLLTQSRRDDLESLGYSVIEIIKKRLPWVDAYDFGGILHQRLSYIKANTSIGTLCSGLPMGIYDYMMTVCGMSYYEYPDYRLLRQMLRSG